MIWILVRDFYRAARPLFCYTARRRLRCRTKHRYSWYDHRPTSSGASQELRSGSGFSRQNLRRQEAVALQSQTDLHKSCTEKSLRDALTFNSSLLHKQAATCTVGFREADGLALGASAMPELQLTTPSSHRARSLGAAGAIFRILDCRSMPRRPRRSEQPLLEPCRANPWLPTVSTRARPPSAANSHARSTRRRAASAGVSS